MALALPKLILRVTFLRINLYSTPRLDHSIVVKYGLGKRNTMSPSQPLLATGRKRSASMSINLSGYLKRARARRLGLPVPPVTGLGNSYRLNFLGFPIGPRGRRSSRADRIKNVVASVASKYGIPMNVINELVDAIRSAEL
jgi:hypothetical protein